MRNKTAAARWKFLWFGSLMAWVMWLASLPLHGAGNDTKKEGTASAKETEAVLLKLDADFSKLSAEKGVQTAFLTYLAENGTILAPGVPPITGKEDIRALLSGNENTKLTWTPLKAEVSGAGDMGYTYGRYESRRERKNLPAKVTTGKYVTVWKKQVDSSWKAVLDIGSTDQSPADAAVPAPTAAPKAP